MGSPRARSFPPVVGRAPRVLILGTMPSRVSLRKRQYYGHPQNLFWRLLGDALGEDLWGAGYAERLRILKRRAVALWDVFASCERRGSLDSAIRGERPNLVGDLVRRRRIRAVFFNGAKARAAFLRAHPEGLPGVVLRDLPSSSPANASVPLARKRRRWRLLAAYCGG